MYNTRKVITILLAGGKGKRFGYHLPKQLFVVNGKTILEYTLLSLSRIPEIDEIIIVSNPEVFSEISKISSYFKKVSKVVEGGENRSISSRNGVFSVKDQNSYILIHDAVRPLVSQELVIRLLENVEDTGSVIPCVASTDMLLEIEGGFFKKLVDRSSIVRVQTPQCFKYEVIYKVYKDSEGKFIDYPDDSTIVSESGFKVKVVEGDVRNLKITTQEDIDLFNVLYNKVNLFKS
ncbi:MAG: 2-C-methyl-D-erythritol 4-phosphate cytidylyltransferase [Brevinematia bacterium]|jgi:2-C-methyl-D-erythritol 4-phosphate cytidylyltransferase